MFVVRLPERLMAFEIDYRINLCWDGFEEWIIPSPLDVHLYHWAGLVVGVMCLASLTVQDRPGPGFPSSSSSRISEQRVRAERRRVSVAGAGGVCWAGPTPQLSDRLKLTHNLRDMSVSENSQDSNLI